MKKRLFHGGLFTLCLCGLTVLSSCSKDDDPGANDDQELITTLTVLFEPEGKGQSVRATYRDLDGPGGQDPTIEGPTLRANTTYTATVTLLDESGTSPRDITSEIEAAGHEHQLFYVVTPEGLASFTPTDTDRNGRPIGLTSRVETGAANSGTVRMVLKHQPGLKNANSNINTGETDIDVTFNTTVQ